MLETLAWIKKKKIIKKPTRSQIVYRFKIQVVEYEKTPENNRFNIFHFEIKKKKKTSTKNKIHLPREM